MSTGYIPKDFSDKELCLALSSYGNFEDFDKLKWFIKCDYSSYGKVVVWHGWSASDLLLLYLMSVLVGENLYHLDTKDISDFTSRKTYFADIGWIAPGDILQLNMFSYVKPISCEERQLNIEEWKKWTLSPDSKNTIRLSDEHTGTINEYPMDFMDDYILECVKNESKWGLVVGKVMWKYDHLFVPDGLIARRIIELWNKGKFDFKIFIR